MNRKSLALIVMTLGLATHACLTQADIARTTDAAGAGGGGSSAAGAPGATGTSGGGGSGAGASSGGGGEGEKLCAGKDGGTCEVWEFCDLNAASECDIAQGGVCRDRPADCPSACAGAWGCDGERYCNECEANQKGVAGYGGACSCRTGLYRVTDTGSSLTIDSIVEVSECDVLSCVVDGVAHTCSTESGTFRVYVDTLGFEQFIFDEWSCTGKWTGIYASEGGPQIPIEAERLP
jgi:hypothetical protein